MEESGPIEFIEFMEFIGVRGHCPGEVTELPDEFMEFEEKLLNPEPQDASKFQRQQLQKTIAAAENEEQALDEEERLLQLRQEEIRKKRAENRERRTQATQELTQMQEELLSGSLGDSFDAKRRRIGE